MHAEVRAYVQRRKPGLPFSAHDLRRFGKRETIDNILVRLVRRRVVRRIGWGLYVAGKAADIAPADLAVAAARARGDKLQVSGQEAAYRLGLITDRPQEYIYFTSGRTQRIKTGKQVVTLQHDASPSMLGAGSQSGVVLSALRHLGPDAITGRDLVTIGRKITLATARRLRNLRPLVPEWMRDYIDALADASTTGR